MQGETGDITRLLASWRAGDRTAMDPLLPLLQRELKRIARRHLARERKDHPCSHPSSLVQEAFLGLLPGRDLGWQDRGHFFRAASCVMRHVLSIEETPAAPGIAPNTVLGDWNFARAWLRRELSGRRLAKSEPQEAD